MYTLGVFAVVSRLKRDRYTVPAKGLQHKLPMDTRVCLEYLPRSFSAPVVVQAMVWITLTTGSALCPVVVVQQIKHKLCMLSVPSEQEPGAFILF